MLNTYKYKEEVWIDVLQGKAEEIQSLVERYGIDPYIAKEIKAESPKSLFGFYDKYIYCILRFPVSKHTHSDGKSQEVDFIIGQDILITARYDTIDALHTFAKELEVDQVLEKQGQQSRHGYVIFTSMLRALYRSILEELEYIEDRIENISKEIFEGEEKEMVVSISETTGTLLDFKRVTGMHGKILESLCDRGGEFFGHAFVEAMEATILDYTKINTIIHSNLEMLRELRETNNSLLTSKQNETIKQLTIIGSILLILNIMAVIYFAI